MKRLFLAACLAVALPVLAITPFTIRDIRVEGVQRTEAGTVFTYLPVKVGDRLDDDRASAAIKALYATGFYSDVRLEADGDVLVVSVQERQAIGRKLGEELLQFVMLHVVATPSAFLCS